MDTARVLATPWMIGFMERTCRNLVLDYLDRGHDTVGTHVDVYHRAAAPIGDNVSFRAEIAEVDGRRVRFRVEARDTDKDLLIGEGSHERTVIDVARFAAKLQSR